jgi:hypothetical protein
MADFQPILEVATIPVWPPVLREAPAGRSTVAVPAAVYNHLRAVADGQVPMAHGNPYENPGDELTGVHAAEA